MHKNSLRLMLLGCILFFSAPVAAENADALSLSDAHHLITRTGFGAAPHELNNLIGRNRVEAVDFIVNGLNSKTTSPPPEWINNSAPHHYRFGNFSTAERQKFRQVRLNEVNSLRDWWIREMISTTNPQKERLLLFWHNHFSTAYSAIDNHSISVARQHMMLREHAAGSFRVMLQNIVRDPAMLNYLDNDNSKKQKPNENLAREIMELFSLGEGSYTESDVKNAARALTGFSFSDTYDMRFVFKSWDHDSKLKTIFGKTGEFDGDDLVDLILDRPEAARYITAKLWRMLISDIDLTDDRLTRHAGAFRNSDYDIKTLYKSLLLSDAFWERSNRTGLVKSPVSLTVGAIRSTGILPNNWQTLAQQQRQMGQHLFEPPNVAGWPGGTAWITPGRLLTRLEWLGQLANESQSITPMPGMSMNNLPESIQPEVGFNMAASMPGDTMGQTMDQKMGQKMGQKMSEDQSLSIRMASEEFDGHVQYRVKVYGKKNAVWDSGVLELAGGHDTKRMGRVERKNLPWQKIEFPIHIAGQNISAIEVSFINDAATPDGADRNLYVDRAVRGDRVWLPSEGKQTGKCARKKPGQRGGLYCPGTLRMEKSQRRSAPSIDPPAADTVRVSSVNLKHVQRAQKKPHTEIVFTLSDVEFDGRFWDTLKIRYEKYKSGYALRLDNTDCWPECLTEWPECAWHNQYNDKTLSLELNQDNQLCMYTGLQEVDKKLARALWMILDDVYEIGKHDQKLQRPVFARNYQQWDALVEEMLAMLPSSAFYDEAINLEIVPRSIIDATLSETLIAPNPASRTIEQRGEDLKQLMQNQPGAHLATLLLPATPTGDISATGADLTGILTDLSFQLK